MENDSKLYALRVEKFSDDINKMRGNIMRNEKMTEFQNKKKTSDDESKLTVSLYDKPIDY